MEGKQWPCTVCRQVCGFCSVSMLMPFANFLNAFSRRVSGYLFFSSTVENKCGSINHVSILLPFGIAKIKATHNISSSGAREREQQKKKNNVSISFWSAFHLVHNSNLASRWFTNLCFVVVRCCCCRCVTLFPN